MNGAVASSRTHSCVCGTAVGTIITTRAGHHGYSGGAIAPRSAQCICGTAARTVVPRAARRLRCRVWAETACCASGGSGDPRRTVGAHGHTRRLGGHPCYAVVPRAARCLRRWGWAIAASRALSCVCRAASRAVVSTLARHLGCRCGTVRTQSARIIVSQGACSAKVSTNTLCFGCRCGAIITSSTCDVICDGTCRTIVTASAYHLT